MLIERPESLATTVLPVRWPQSRCKTDWGREGEAAWAYQHRPNVTGFLLRRQKSLALSDEVKHIAWKAQYRLHKRYQALAARGKNKNQIVTALGRELLGFLWAIAVHTEKQLQLPKAA